MRYLEAVLVFVLLAFVWGCGDDDGEPPEPDAAVDAAIDAEVISFDHPARVLHITDGDTIKVRYQDQEWDIRFLCVDTPETTTDPPEPYAIEARTFTTNYATPATTIGLEFDDPACAVNPSATACLDQYGRLLAYVRTRDELDLNALLLANGLALIPGYADCGRLAAYEEVQAQAEAQGLGIHSL